MITATRGCTPGIYNERNSRGGHTRIPLATTIDSAPLDPPAGPDPSRDGATPLLAAAGLALLLGIQLLRVFLPLATFHLHDALALSPAATGGISLLVLATGLGAPALAKRLGWWNTLRWVAGLLALTRVGEQLAGGPALDAGLALVGTALLAVLLSLLLLAASREASSRSRLAFIVVAALALETALRTLAGTLDLSWHEHPAAQVVVLTSAATCLLAAALARRPAGTEPAPAARPWAGVALGAWLAVYLLIFSNPAQLAARTGLPLERASWFVLGGWLAGIAIAGLVPLHGASRWRSPEAAALAGAGAWIAVFGGADGWFGMLIGIPGMAILLLDLLSGRARVHVRGPGPGVAGVVLLLVLYLAYGRFDQAFGPSERAVYALAVGLLVAGCLAAVLRARTEPVAPFWRLWLAGLALAAVLAAVASRLLAPLPAPPELESDGPIRIMTYNLHQGFDVDGRLAPQALARVIELEAPDVLALQEVPRGWLVTGGLDLHSWLLRRLGLRGRFAGTADAQWGNAVLSRLPMRRSVYHPLPPDDLPLRRGVLDVTFATRRADLRVLCLHLHHRRGDHQIRNAQIDELLRIWGGSPATVLLGDFNALPDSAAIQTMRAAGLRDASAWLPSTGRGTTTRLDGRQIDWIFATRDLAFESTTMRYSRASDHLPLMTTVHFTTRTPAARPSGGSHGRRRPD